MKDIPIIELRSVELRIGNRVILHPLSLQVLKGENFFIIGGSGAGKSTLLRIMIGLTKPTEGEVLLLGRPLRNLSTDELNSLRRKVGFVFQYSALFDFMKVYDNVAFPLRLQKVSEDLIREKVIAVLKDLDVLDAMNLYPFELSGGMRKRVALARAIVSEPEVIMYDEPTSGLDPIMSDVINRIIKRFNEKGITNVVVTHDIASAFEQASRIAFIHKGELRFLGKPEEALKSEDPLLADFLSKGFKSYTLKGEG